MLDGNLMDYLGRPVMRTTDAMRGKITALMHASYDVDGDGDVDEDDMVFELTLNNGEVHTMAARSSLFAEGPYKLV